MACNYYYKGKLIGNEYQLDDFLLEKKEYLSQFGDRVFEFTPRALEELRIIENEMAADGKRKKALLNSYVASHGVTYNEDGEVIQLEKPAMGVNKFLSKYTHPDGPNKGKQIEPEFREKDYWNNRKTDWKSGVWTDDEKKLIKDMTGEEPDASKTYTDADYDSWAKEIQAKWTAQGQTGSALHAISELFFGKNSAGDYIFDVFEADPSQITNYYNLQFKNKKDEYGTITYGDYVDLASFRKMVEMCQKLKKQIENQYGECTFYPEFTVTAKASQEVDGCTDLIGIIDLLVVDEKGRTHIYDFKTSPKAYGDYASAKKRSFTLQLAVYDRILQKYGINTLDGSCQIIPILLNNFRREGGTFTFDDISYEINEDTVDTRDLTGEIRVSNKLNRDLNEFLPVSLNLNPKSSNLIEKVSAAEKVLFPTHQMMRNQSDEELDKMLEEAGAYKANKAGQLTYKFTSGFQEPIVVDIAEAGGIDRAKVKLFKEVQSTIQSWTHRKHALALRFVEAFNLAVKDGSDFELEGAEGVVQGNSLWLQETMRPYCNGEYELYEDDAALNFGVVYLQHKKSGAVTVLKLSGSVLDFLHEFRKGCTNLNGNFASDVEENSKGNSLMLKAINGNIEAMEAMLVLQNTDFLGGQCNVREIKVINPYSQTGMPVSNKELLYTYKNLLQKENFLGTDENKFAGKNPQIKMLDQVENLRFKFHEILERGDFGSSPGKFTDIKTHMEGFDWNAKDSEIYNQLNKLRIELENTYDKLLKEVKRQVQDLSRPENQLYIAVTNAMLQLKNIDVRQQIQDADNWLQKGNILKDGWEGLNLENPGNFRSLALNQLTKSVSNVYQKVKDYVNKQNVTVRGLVEKLKQQKNFGYIKSNVSGNQTDMYKNMTVHTPDGEFLFVNPNTLHGAEKEFLEYALKTINKDRWGESDATLESWKNSAEGSINYLKYYRVPLMAASTGSKMSTTDYANVLKDRAKTWSPKGALKEMEEKAAGFFDTDTSKRQNDKARVFEMTNKFESGEGDHRLDIIKAGDNGNGFEHNIETLLLAHSYAYSLKREMDKEMPLMKATALALSMQGAGANFGKDGNFTNLIDFIEKYVKAKVKNESVNSEDMRKWEAISGKARKAASFLSLAFSPLQFTYQTMEGIWKACSLVIRKPDGTDTFTAKNMWDAFKSAYTDLAHYSDKPSKCQLLNEAYGLNDMDANQFAQRISSDHGIWTHFTDFAFKFASRPDFYNRMTIWGAQMRADGTWDAHHVGKNGELVYEFKKDKRYAAMFTAPKGSAEYNQALSRYMAALEQFQMEGVTNPETGEELQFGDDLPRAYTNLEAQGMKAIADGMYGYYNHENKSMMNSMFLGSLATQMKTYWSAKKNQYLAPGGVKLVGHWEDYQENGEQMYYAKNDAGEIDLAAGMVKADDPNCSGVKVTKWKGQWQEGIVSTLYKFCTSVKEKGSFSEAWTGMWDIDDPNLQTAYRSNLKHLAIDLFFIALGGVLTGLVLEPWDDEYKKEFYKDLGNKDKASAYMLSHFLTQTVDHSFMDFNFFDSIFSPTVDWQPFAFSSLLRVASNGWDCLTGDATFVNSLANTMSIARQTKPLLKSLTYEDQ